MKKIFLLLAMVMLFSLAGCTNENKNKENTLDIVTSFYPIYIATANIVDGASDVTLTNLTSTDVGCLHDYQLTTANLMVLENADILVVNGGGMESFIQKAVDNCESLVIINSSEGILEEHEHQHEHSDDHDHGKNAHIWVSVSLYEKQVERIRDQLVKLDRKNAEKYMENSNKYLSKLQELKDEMHNELDKIENKDIVTFHEAFEFFAEEFNLNIVEVIEREPGSYPSAGEVAEIIDTVKSSDAKAIFVEPQYSKTAANTISRETNIAIYNLDPIVSGRLEKDAYEKAMRQNLKTLVEALEE